MTVTTFNRVEFECSLVAGGSNPTTITVDFLDASGAPSEPLDGYQYETFVAQACPIPTQPSPLPDPLLTLTVLHLPGFIPKGDTDPHPGAFLLMTDPTEAMLLQTEWVPNGLIDLWGVTATGQRDQIARGFFSTVTTATREFNV